jgi:YggT family protein
MLARLLDLYSLIVLVAVVMSWMQVPSANPLARFVHTMTEPVLDPIRRALPPMGGLDFSPMVLLIGLRILRSLLG